MIEVVTHGNTWGTVTYKTNCPKCGCVFKFQETDTEQPLYWEFVINCPECNEIIDVSDLIL